MDVRSLFSTPFAIETVDDRKLDEDLRAAIIAERRRDPRGIVRSNFGGWHSSMAMLAWGGAPARKLAERAIALADALTANAAELGKTRFEWSVEMWANVVSRGHSHQFHIHPGKVWSAVYYLDDGYCGSTDPALGGELQLLDPRMPAVQMAAPELSLREATGEVQHAELTLRPRTATLVLFPAWLQHGVRPFAGEGERISIAINLKPRRGGTAA